MPAVDLRSDTVTRPSVAMRRAMAEAIVGDDVFGDDPTVNALEARVAEMFGHEAGELLAGADAHVVTYELGAAAALGGISSRTWPAVGADLDPASIVAMIRPQGYPSLPTRAIAIEQTHNLGGGAVVPLPILQELRSAADRSDVLLHCDGARIWHAHIADGVPLATYGRLFDTLSVCLSKGLGAPIGSLVVGSAERIARARIIRKRMGGGMRQVGILAAAGEYALTHNITRLAEDHERAQRLAVALAKYGVVDPTQVRTNLVPVDLTGTNLDAPGFAARAAAKDVHIAAMLPHLARIVVHLDIDDNALDQAITVLTGILAEEA
jgi:threonine aldolase